MQKVKEWALYGAVFLFTAFAYITLLALTACIPRTMIQKNCEKTALFLGERELFVNVVIQKDNTKLDYYADSILFNMIYSIDSDRPLYSVVADNYYFQESAGIKGSLLKNVRQETEPENQYSRYWHGSMVLLRPLLCFTDISGIHKLFRILCLALFFAIEILLIKEKAYDAAVIYPVALCITKWWIVTQCIEYSMTFLVMQAMVLLFMTFGAKSNKNVYLLSIVSGVTVCFVDFLTAETLAVTVPLYFLWIKKGKNGSLKAYVTALLLWLVSYAGMFALKWTAAMTILGKNVMEDTLNRAGERMNGTMLGAVCRNMYTLFPINRYSQTSVKALCIAVFFLCISVAGIYYVKWCQRFWKAAKSSTQTKEMQRDGLIPVILMLIPYMRYIVLSNHSYIHYFFTYRAQLVSLLVIMMCFGSMAEDWFQRLTDTKCLRKK
jgi:hypothetical protein